MLSKVRSNKIFKTSKYGESAAKQEENILEDKNREGGRERLQVKHWLRNKCQYDATHVISVWRTNESLVIFHEIWNL